MPGNTWAEAENVLRGHPGKQAHPAHPGQQWPSISLHRLRASPTRPFQNPGSQHVSVPILAPIPPPRLPSSPEASRGRSHLRGLWAGCRPVSFKNVSFGNCPVIVRGGRRVAPAARTARHKTGLPRLPRGQPPPRFLESPGDLKEAPGSLGRQQAGFHPPRAPRPERNYVESNLFAGFRMGCVFVYVNLRDLQFFGDDPT